PGAICGNIDRRLNFCFDKNRVNTWRITGVTMPQGELFVQVSFNAKLRDPKQGLSQANMEPKHSSSLTEGVK
ncbi:MAG: hypothetical protein K2X81_02020, partial [Candidatus Obscuribacterales bacterium]|nr:hypothetical protein [Candidatus Obscuribacterales bacterium]